MTTIYKFKAYFTEQGIGAAPSSAPVATVLDTDANTKLADAQASTAKSNLPGYYEYEYSGADNLDLVCLFHTSDTGTDQQDLVSYVVEKVYQADAKLDVIDGIVDAILVDTGTDIPASITTVQADLDNPSQYKADVSALALEATLTAMKGAGWTDETLVAIKSVIDAILVDTGTTLDAKLDTIDGIVDSILVDTGTTLDGKITTIDGIVDDILVDTGTDIPASIAALDTDSVLDATIDGVYTVEQVLQIMVGSLAGKLSGGGTDTLTFRDLSDTLDRIVATVDASKNRTGVTYNV
jgi:hypothetical protein